MRKYLIIILLAAAFLRFYGLERGDTVNDEVFYAFRGLGLMDFDKAPDQPTPLEWFDFSTSSGQAQIPWWTKLSFHDHPPLIFWVQHFFMSILGDEVWAFRLPSALLGVASVYLVYLLGAMLFSESAGILSSAFFAVTLNNVYISRAGMQESYVIFFMLLASYFFLKAIKGNFHYLIWTGLALGLGFLTKYNVFIMVPIFLTYLLIFKREYFGNKKFWLGALLAILLFSPVIIYNYELYKSVGHFDFQLSYIFQQHPKEWPVAPGKEIGSLGERVKNFIPRLIASNSWVFLILFAVSLLFLRNAFLFLIFAFLFLLLLLIGPSYRFLTMLTPWMAIVVGMGLEQCLRAGLACHPERSEESKKALLKSPVYIVLLTIFLFEIFYAVNNQIAYYPAGPTPWLASKVRYENYNWGYNDLDDYLERELKGKMPALTFYPKYQFLNKLQDKILEQDRQRNLKPYPALLVYYGNVDDGARLWIFDRLRFYHAWPVISLADYKAFAKERGADYYLKSGFKNYYFMLSTNIVPSAEFRALVKDRSAIGILNHRGEEVFKIYKFSI